MGDAFRRLRIPVGDVLSSPTYRTRESVGLAAFGKPKIVDELDDGGQSMQANADNECSAWLHKKVSESPRKGKTRSLWCRVLGAPLAEWSFLTAWGYASAVYAALDATNMFAGERCRLT